jgi:hypothetical protein
MHCKEVLMYTILLVVNQNKELVGTFYIIGVSASILAILNALLIWLGGRKSF